jgi:hypothetical protein
LSRAEVDKRAARQPTQEAQNRDNGTCLGCHGTEGFSVAGPDGRARDLHVNRDKLAASKHGELPCVMCHQAITSIPHPESARVAKVDCGACHSAQKEEYLTSVHGVEAVQKVILRRPAVQIATRATRLVRLSQTQPGLQSLEPAVPAMQIASRLTPTPITAR